ANQFRPRARDWNILDVERLGRIPNFEFEIHQLCREVEVDDFCVGNSRPTINAIICWPGSFVDEPTIPLVNESRLSQRAVCFFVSSVLVIVVSRKAHSL